MRQKTFAVAGDTLNEEKYAFKIKQGLLEKDYTVYAVGKEAASFNDIPCDIDIIDLCINPIKGLALYPRLPASGAEPVRKRAVKYIYFF